MAHPSLFLLVVQVKVTEVTIFHLQAAPTCLNAFVHFSELFFEFADNFERRTLNIIFVKRDFEVAVQFFQLHELVFNALYLTYRHRFEEGADIAFGRLG